MAVVVLTFTSSEDEITSGIPREVEISSNIPSVIYYTVDGTTPTESSPIYVSAINMPDNETSVVLSAFGIDGDGYAGSILTQTFAADTTSIDRTRNVLGEGLVVDLFDDTTDYVLAYDADGDATAYTDIDNIDLETRYSAVGYRGIEEGAGIETSFSTSDETACPFDDNFQIESDASDTFFNPYAKTIVVDSRKENVIPIINRPFGSLRSLQREWLGQRELGGTDSTYISGGFMRAYYNPKTNIRVSYYWDHNTCRWIKSISELDSSEIPSTIGNFNQTGQPLVFRWIDRGRHSSIPI